MNARRTRAEVLEKIAAAELGAAHTHAIELILATMKPLTRAEHKMLPTSVLVPKGYNHMHVETKAVSSFVAVTNDFGGVDLWIPGESLEIAMVTHGCWCNLGNKTCLYLWNGKKPSDGGRLFNKLFVADRSSQRLGPFFAPAKKK